MTPGPCRMTQNDADSHKEAYLHITHRRDSIEKCVICVMCVMVENFSDPRSTAQRHDLSIRCPKRKARAKFLDEGAPELVEHGGRAPGQHPAKVSHSEPSRAVKKAGVSGRPWPGNPPPSLGSSPWFPSRARSAPSIRLNLCKQKKGLGGGFVR